MVDQEGRDPSDEGKKQSLRGYLHHLAKSRTVLLTILKSPINWWREGDHARRTANGTAVLALGTLILAAVNLCTISDTAKIAQASRDQADIAKKTLAGLERPYVLAAFDFEDMDNAQLMYQWSIGRKRMLFPFKVINWGRTPAEIIAIRCNEITSEAGIFHQKEFEQIYNRLISRLIIKADGGEASEACSNSPPTADFSQGDPKNSLIMRGTLWFIGLIDYEDFFGNSYTTTFCLQIWRSNSAREAGRGDCNRRT